MPCLALQAIRGQAIDRHLLGLKLQAIEDLAALPEIFMDTSYAVALHYNLSTSQVMPNRALRSKVTSKTEVLVNRCYLQNNSLHCVQYDIQYRLSFNCTHFW